MQAGQQETQIRALGTSADAAVAYSNKIKKLEISDIFLEKPKSLNDNLMFI